MHTPTDEQLMDRHLHGDGTAFTTIYNRHVERIRAFIIQLLRLRAIALLSHAEDLVQQTFCVIHSRRDQFLRGTRLTAWLFSTASRATLNLIKSEGRAQRNHRRTTALADMLTEPAVADPLEAQQEAEYRKITAKAAIEQGITVLPETHRRTMRRVLDGKTTAQIAKELGEPATTISYWRRQSLEMMRTALDREPAA